MVQYQGYSLDMDKSFNFKERESDIYKRWEESGVFTPVIDPLKKPFTIIMPPPNANGVLHAGHALFVTVQDIMTRWHRMKGDPTLWLPGSDHAGIATQVTFEKVLDKQGKSRFDLGREEFIKQTYEFTQSNKQTMESQLRALGASCDWSREKFTLDPDVSLAVTETFKRLYDDGLIYRGERIINWCYRCGTGVSDVEVEHVEEEGVLTYIKYPLTDGSGEIVVATTRPETMLGDTAVAVNPDDDRYKNMIGKTVELPILKRNIPVVADSAVDPEFGTGAVKVTPAHSQVDFEIAERHGLPKILVIGKNGRIVESVEGFAGLKIKEARQEVLDQLSALGLVEKTTSHFHSVARCERCNTVIEPLLSEQWFVKMSSLAQRTLEAIESGEVEFVPDRFTKIFSSWMENIRDWNISRQLWWGHRVPVWYLVSDRLRMTVAHTETEAKEKLGGEVEQDEDTLDTWFSSGLWPFTTLGWPKETDDYKYFYPTTVMETGRDLIFFWVARMVMLGIYCTGRVPFETVYMHGLVNDAQGKKMSKSKGNGVDPIEMVEKYGADALRLALIIGNVPGADQALSEDKIRGYRNFANKVWNVARFVEMSLQGDEPEGFGENLDDASQKIVEDWKAKKSEVDELLAKYRFDLAGDAVYHFLWDELADKYIEYVKDKTDDIKIRQTLKEMVRQVLVVLHPFVPFVTEAVWSEMYQGRGMLIAEEWGK